MAGIGHKGFMGGNKSSFCPYLPGLYSESEIDDLVFIDGYIPVYDAAEFDKIRTGAVEVMGGCTKWGGNYTTGVDKKYVQVGVCDFTAFGNWSSTISGFSGIYDGNEINIQNLTSTTGLFDDTSGDFTNIIVFNASLDASAGASAQRGVLINNISSGNISKTYVSGSIINRGRCALIVGGVSALSGNVTIQDCYTSGSVESVVNESGSSNVAGIIGAAIGNATYSITITRCVNSASCESARDNVGGISGRLDYCIVSECYNTGTITANNNFAGGCFGLLFDNNQVENCYSIANVTGASSAGFAAYMRNSTTVVNCFSVGTVTGSSPSGFIDTVLTGSTATNCYWDTTVGPATSTAGTGQTTSALQTPTSNTGIYSAWTIPPWDFGTATDYPTLTTTP